VGISVGRSNRSTKERLSENLRRLLLLDEANAKLESIREGGPASAGSLGLDDLDGLGKSNSSVPVGKAIIAIGYLMLVRKVHINSGNGGWKRKSKIQKHLIAEALAQLPVRLGDAMQSDHVISSISMKVARNRGLLHGIVNKYELPISQGDGGTELEIPYVDQDPLCREPTLNRRPAVSGLRWVTEDELRFSMPRFYAAFEKLQASRCRNIQEFTEQTVAVLRSVNAKHQQQHDLVAEANKHKGRKRKDHPPLLVKQQISMIPHPAEIASKRMKG